MSRLPVLMGYDVVPGMTEVLKAQAGRCSLTLARLGRFFEGCGLGCEPRACQSLYTQPWYTRGSSAKRPTFYLTAQAKVFCH